MALDAANRARAASLPSERSESARLAGPTTQRRRQTTASRRDPTSKDATREPDHRACTDGSGQVPTPGSPVRKVQIQATTTVKTASAPR